MSHYIDRFCSKHGEWSQDVDDPYEECPSCIEEGIAPSQIVMNEKAQLISDLAEMRRQRDEMQTALEVILRGVKRQSIHFDMGDVEYIVRAALASKELSDG